jgi:hypothetical protein
MCLVTIGLSIQPIGSRWFAKGEGQELAEMARAGTLDHSALKNRWIPVKAVHEGFSPHQNANLEFNKFPVVP